MATPTPKELAQVDLPNFPAELLENWLGTFLQSEGWPPILGSDGVPTDRWRYLLSRRSLSYWQSVMWHQEQRELAQSELEPRSLATILSLIDGYINGATNMFTEQIDDGKQRFGSLLNYTMANGTMPVPPVLISEEQGLTVMDGNHRISALFVCRHLSQKEPDKLRAIGKTCQSVHTAWIGYVQQPHA
jgi:hypothetical protein